MKYKVAFIVEAHPERILFIQQYSEIPTTDELKPDFNIYSEIGFVSGIYIQTASQLDHVFYQLMADCTFNFKDGIILTHKEIKSGRIKKTHALDTFDDLK